ncbi:MAG TPA: nitrilase-related carbon-nitrogen hydrolase, partial [Burkholderiales bacterium]|nr:nitrilase-related carbon-nitrogen hydrolase [Burkholderiales bacterium]
MKIAIAQINCTVGDLAGNAARILDFAQRARAEAADVLLTPELALCGYPPEDLLLRDDFYRSCDSALRQLAAQIKGITAVVGHPHQDGRQRYNAASIIQDGRIVATYHKHALPNYTVFDEERYFESDDKPCVFQINGKTLGINICEDTWDPFAPRAARAAGAQVLLVLNASPYHLRKQHTRYDVMRERVAENGIPLIYANMVGGQDELVFDGASFALNRAGVVTHQLPMFKEALAFLTIENGDPLPGEISPERSVE